MGKKNKSKSKGKNSKSKNKIKKQEVQVVEEEEEVETIVDISDDENSEDETSDQGGIQEVPETEDTLDPFDKGANEYFELLDSFQEVQKEEVEILAKLKEVQAKRKKMFTEIKRSFTKLNKTKSDVLRKALKQKRKRKGGTSGGFNAEKPVPGPLIKYLELDDGTELSRPKVVSLLHKKFSEKGLKDEDNRHNTVLDKEAAKILGGKVGQNINMLTDFQKFVKQIYENN